MFIDVIKFIHVMLALSLLGLVATHALRSRAMGHAIVSEHVNGFIRHIIPLSLLALLTGTLLVYPKHFTYHTPWIEAAYTLLITFILIWFALHFLAKRRAIPRWLGSFIYIISLVILLGIIHDAVTKTVLF